MMKDGLELFKKFENEVIAKEKRLIQETFQPEIENIKKMWGIQIKQLSYYSKLIFQGMFQEQYSSMFVSALSRNMYAVYSMLLLMEKGLFGSARLLLRNAFEFLIIVKFLHLSGDERLLNKWLDEAEEGKGIYLGREVFPRLIKPIGEKFKPFFTMLHKFTHATKYSQQMKLDSSDPVMHGNILGTFKMIQGLLECNFHLLNSYFMTKRLKHFLDYNVPEISRELKTYNTQIKTLFKENKKNMFPELKTFIYNYKLKWEIRK